MKNLKISTHPVTGLSAYIDDQGRAFLTDTLIRKITGIDNKTLDGIVASYGVGNFAEEYTLTLEGQGTRGVRSLRQASDFKIILRAWKPTKKENKERKNQIIDSLIDAGTTAYIYNLCGYTMQPKVEAQKPERTLPQHTVVEYVQAQKDIEKINNSTLKELLRDQLIDELSILQRKALPSNQPKQYTIAKVRARELGYSTQEIGNGSMLGKFLAKNVPIAFTERVGKYSVNHYEINDQLDTAIKTFFGMRKCLTGN